MKISKAPIESMECVRICLDQGEGHEEPCILDKKLPLHEVVHVYGQRGVGKSYFLRLLAGLEMPQGGELLINEQNISDLSFEEFLKFRLNIGYAFEYGGLINNMTVFENLMLPLRYHNLIAEEEARERVLNYLKLFSLDGAKDKRPAFISGSMRKEVCILRAFVMEPELILLDNPTAGMNKDNVIKLKQMILDKKKSGTLKHVFIVSENDELLSGLIGQNLELCWTEKKQVA